MTKQLSIGKFLKMQRELKQLSCKMISQKTKIHITNLERLEKEDFKNLPNKAYLLGYIKSYAKSLNLNQEECLTIFNNSYNLYLGVNDSETNTSVSDIQKVQSTEKQQLSSLKTNNRTNISNKESDETLNSDLVTKITIGIVLFIVVVILFFMTGSNNDHSLKSSEEIKIQNIIENDFPQKIIIKQTNIEKEKVIEKETVIEKEKPKLKKIEKQDVKTESIKAKTTQKKASEEIKKKSSLTNLKKVTSVPIVKKNDNTNEIQKITKEDNDNNKKVEDAEQIAIQEIKYYNFKFPLYKINKDIKTQKSIGLIPEKFRSSLQNGVQNILVNSQRGDSWITYKNDNNAIKKFILKQGRSILIHGKLVKIFIGNLSNVNIFLNNELLSLNSPSNVKSLVFPQEKAQSLKLPLFIFKDGNVTLTPQKKQN